MLGCDGPIANGKEHVIQLSSTETIRLNTCPRKEVNKATEFLRVYQWAKDGRLPYLYDSDQLPAYMGQAIDLVSLEVNKSYLEKVDGQS